MLNTLLADMMYHKARAENYLRCSGLDYAIFRPPHLTGDIQDCTETPYSIGQGTLASSKITRYTLGKVIVDCI